MELNNETSSISLHALSNIMLSFKLKEEPLFFRKDLLCPNKIIFNFSTAIIYTIKNDPDSTNEFNFKIEYVNAPVNHPTSSIVQNADMLAAYKSSNVLDKQTLTLDPLYAAEFSEQPLESKIIHICFPNLHTFRENVIAVVTNYGQCEIMTINLKNRIWDKTILEVNNLWEDIFPSSLYYNETIREFKNIREYIEDYTITTCCWLDNLGKSNENILFCSTISGWIIVIKIIEEHPWLIKLQFKVKTDLYKINHLQSYSYTLKNGIHKTIIICGDIHGRIKVFNFNENNQHLIEIYTMWNTKDHMSSKNYVINYCSQSELLFLTTSKSSHFLLLIVSANNDQKVFNKTQFCETQIIGFDSINPYEYLICTANGYTKHLKLIKTEQNTYTIVLNNIINDFETENYITIGTVATPNKVGWLFLFYPHKMYIHTQNRKKFGFLSIYTLNTVDPLHILKNIPTEKCLELENYNDCNEIIRLRIQKNILNENYSSFSIEPIEINDLFLHRLRIQLILIKGIGCYNLRKVKTRGEIIEFEENDIIVTIKVLSAYWRLKYLQNIENLSNFQKKSVKCLRRFLTHYLTVNLTENYSNIRDKFKSYYENLLESTKNKIDNFEENCVYCGQNVDIPTEACTHDFPRCFISFVQIINMKNCEKCEAAVLNDDTLLKEILFENEKIKCIFCGVYIT